MFGGDSYIREQGTSDAVTVQYDSQRLYFRGNYWNGSTAVNQDAHIFTDAAPSGAALNFNITGTQVAMLYNNEIKVTQPIKALNTTLTLKGRPTDGAGAVGTVIGNDTNLTTAGAKLVQVINGVVEKSFIDKDGGAYFAGAVGIGTTA